VKKQRLQLSVTTKKINIVLETTCFPNNSNQNICNKKHLLESTLVAQEVALMDIKEHQKMGCIASPNGVKATPNLPTHRRGEIFESSLWH